MLTCKEVSRLVSESLDRRLPPGRRLAVRMHLLMCGACRAYKSRMVLLRKMLRLYAARPFFGAELKLSERARERIRRLLFPG